MVEIIRLNDDPHRQTQQLLPWYVTGTLDREETALVEQHVGECAECREDLETEAALAREIKALPGGARQGGADQGWAALKASIEAGQASLAPNAMRRRVPTRWNLAGAAGLAIAASVATFLLMRPPSLYRTLSAPPGAASGNLIVIFTPETPEAALRAVLQRNGARIVDGPTSVGAYVLHVAEDQRAAVLARLKSNRNISVAEPIDGDAR
jgi:anti-sigma factor RsiW